MKNCVRPFRKQRLVEYTNQIGAKFNVGDRMWLCQNRTRCSDPSRSGIIDGIVSEQVLNVDCTPRHIRDIRPREAIYVENVAIEDLNSEVDLPLFTGDPIVEPAPAVPPIEYPEIRVTESIECNGDVTPAPTAEVPPRSSTRDRRPPLRYGIDDDL